MIFINYTKGLLCDGLTFFKATTGRALREAGLQIDIAGSRRIKDIAYL